MFSLWSMLNSPLTAKDLLKEKLEKSLQNLKLPITSFYKTKDDKTKGNLMNKIKETQLKQIEKDLIKKFSDYLNIDEDISADMYLSFTESSLNPLIVSSDLLERLAFQDLFSSSFLKLVEYYYRERYSFLKVKTLILSSIVENTPYNYNEQNIMPYDNLGLIKQMFKQEDIMNLYKSCMRDYNSYCKEIKTLSAKKTNESNIENLNERCLVQIIKEFELNLELLLILSNLITISKDIFYELVKEFKGNSILKHLTTLIGAHSNEMAECIEQINYLQTLIIMKATKLDKLVMENNTAYFTQEEKAQLLNADTKNLITDLISSYGSNQKASPVCLTWATLLYNLTIDPDLNKLITNETKNLTNRLFGMSIKENVFAYLLDLFASGYFANQEVLWHIKQIVYDFLNSVLHSFDESSMGDNLKTLFELCFFCMDKNELICENFWKACNLPDRENLTILMSHSIEKFPISLGLCFTFFSLISKTNPDLCKQTIDFLSNMDQYCEYLDNLNPDEFTSFDDSIKLLKNHKLFDTFTIPAGQKGVFLGGYISSSNQKQNSNRMILKSTAISWRTNFNCFELILCYLNRINYAAEQNALQDDMNNIITIIGLIDSLLINFFNIDDQDPIVTSYMEKFVNSCFCLFTHLMNHQSKESYTLLSKLIELFNNIVPQIYDKLIRILEQNSLIGFDQAFNKMALEQIFNNRFNLMNSCSKQLFIFKSHDYELIINYLKLIDNLIKESGNGIQYLSPVCCVLLNIFPHIHKWKSQTLNFNLELSSSCLTLLHSVLNAQSNFSNQFPDAPSKINFSIDQFCEQILINTECSESLLGLINSSYAFSQDLNHLNDIKKLDNIIIQSVSLINRLIFVPYSPSTTVLDKSSLSINHSQLYINLIKSINIQSQSSSFQAITSLTDDKSEYTEIIKNNNKFLMQLNLMMTKPSADQTNILSSDADIEISQYSSGVNWFHLLTKIAINKSNQILDCLLFSIFKKLSQLTPRLFGSLLGPFTNQFHKIILEKLNINSDGQILKIICEFLCSLVENQPGFFQILANIKVEANNQGASTSAEPKTEKPQSTEKFIEGEKSVLKALFDLLAQIKNQPKWNDRNSNITIAGIYSIFYTLWLNKKTDYVNYCKQKKEFWPTLASTLQIIKKEVKNLKNTNNQNATYSSINTIPTEVNSNDETISDYLEYFGFDNAEYENQFTRFNEFVLEANIKSISYAFKIFSIEVFELFIFEKAITNEFAKFLTENIFEKNLVEKWLDFYIFQLKKDLNNETQELLSKFEFYDLEQQQSIRPDLTIIDTNVYRNKAKQTDEAVKKFLKSKLLFDSIKMFLLLINKINRISAAQKQQPATAANTSTTIVKILNVKNIRLDVVFSILLQSMTLIINHLFSLNNILLRAKREQEQLLENFDSSSYASNKSLITTNSLIKLNGPVDDNYIKLKESNETVKQFHSLSSTIMILITSIKDITQTNLTNTKVLIYDLTRILENLLLDDFNYFPSIINSTMVSILHVLSLNNQNTNNVIDIFKSDEMLFKKFVQTLCKIFTISVKNLELLQNSNTIDIGVEENFNIFILNIKLLKFIMSKFDSKYWYHELVECCAVQFMYTLFEKYIQNDQNSYMVYAILELFYTFSQTQCDHLMKSNFNANTCLLASKLFDYAFSTKEATDKKIKLTNLPVNTAISWSNVLCLYIDIQTILLTKLKYKYLNDSILFFGSYYEAMIQIITRLNYSIEPSLLKLTQSIARFFTQISIFKKELMIGMSSYSINNLEKLYCIVLQLSIEKISNIKGLLSKGHHHTVIGQHDSFQAKPSRIDLEELLLCQNLLFSISSFCLDAIYHYIPNLASPLTNIEEYNLLVAVNLNPPSSFDCQTPLSFGSILWMIDYCMKLLQKYESSSSTSNSDNLNTSSGGLKNILSQNSLNKTGLDLNKSKKLSDISAHEGLSPRKNVTIIAEDPSLESKQPAKNLVNSILEKLFNFLFTQIILFERQNQYSGRDRKIFKREISLELNSIINGFHKTQKKSASTGQSQYASKSPVLSTQTNSNSQNVNAGNLVASEFTKLFQNLLSKELNI